MKALQRFFAVVSYDRMREIFSSRAMEFEESRNKIRKTALDEIEKLQIHQDGVKIQEIMIQMNRDLTSTYEKEKELRQFIDLCK